MMRKEGIEKIVILTGKKITVRISHRLFNKSNRESVVESKAYKDSILRARWKKSF